MGKQFEEVNPIQGVGGKNACATYFGHISVISIQIRVVSKSNVKSSQLSTKLKLKLKLKLSLAKISSKLFKVTKSETTPQLKQA